MSKTPKLILIKFVVGRSTLYLVGQL